MKRLPILVMLFATVALLAAACGSDADESADDETSSQEASSDGNGSSTDDGGKPNTDASPEELQVWQSDLNAVGCYVGPVDGAAGPQTEAAIQAFQAAKGLTVDGLLGPQTEGALQDAVAAGETVCTSSDGGEGEGADDGGGALDGSDQASLSSASYDNTFTLGRCSLASDLANLSMQGEVNGLTLVADAVEGNGTVGVSGGNESDGITLNGTITSVTIDPSGSFTASGEFGEPNNVGEAFTLSGSCVL
jgi:peptidoglycan hydrolase-like protein with peptidoglycan-binding domain